jgi:hypothetical protein
MMVYIQTEWGYFCLASLLVLSLFSIWVSNSWTDLQYTQASSENMIDAKESLEIIKSVPFNNTTLPSIVVDPLRNLVYVSVNPDYP